MSSRHTRTSHTLTQINFIINIIFCGTNTFRTFLNCPHYNIYFFTCNLCSKTVQKATFKLHVCTIEKNNIFVRCRCTQGAHRWKFFSCSSTKLSWSFLSYYKIKIAFHPKFSRCHWNICFTALKNQRQLSKVPIFELFSLFHSTCHRSE